MSEADDRKVRQALDGLEGVAAATSAWATQDPAVRAAYQTMLKAMSKRIWTQYQSGKLSAEAAAQAANEGRNFVLRLARMASTPEGRAAAIKLKANGLSLEQLLERYAQKLHGKPFGTLSEPQRTAVFEEIIQSAGRSRAAVDESMRALGATSRLFWALTVLMALFDISTARDKVKATVHIIAVMGVGIVAGEVLGGVIGSFAGPIGTGVGVVLGGILGGWLVDHYLYDDANPALTGS